MVPDNRDRDKFFFFFPDRKLIRIRKMKLVVDKKPAKEVWKKLWECSRNYFGLSSKVNIGFSCFLEGIKCESIFCVPLRKVSTVESILCSGKF